MQSALLGVSGAVFPETFDIVTETKTKCGQDCSMGWQPRWDLNRRRKPAKQGLSQPPSAVILHTLTQEYPHTCKHGYDHMHTTLKHTLEGTKINKPRL